MTDEILMNAEERMEKALVSLHEVFSTVRTGRANALGQGRPARHRAR